MSELIERLRKREVESRTLAVLRNIPPLEAIFGELWVKGAERSIGRAV